VIPGADAGVAKGLTERQGVAEAVLDSCLAHGNGRAVVEQARVSGAQYIPKVAGHAQIVRPAHVSAVRVAVVPALKGVRIEVEDDKGTGARGVSIVGRAHERLDLAPDRPARLIHDGAIAVERLPNGGIRIGDAE